MQERVLSERRNKSSKRSRHSGQRHIQAGQHAEEANKRWANAIDTNDSFMCKEKAAMGSIAVQCPVVSHLEVS